MQFLEVERSLDPIYPIGNISKTYLMLIPFMCNGDKWSCAEEFTALLHRNIYDITLVQCQRIKPCA